jgi:hypothetical protein
LELSVAQLDAGVELARVAATAQRAVWLCSGRNRDALAHRARIHELLGESDSALLVWREALTLTHGEDVEERRARARIEAQIRRLVSNQGAAASQPARR